MPLASPPENRVTLPLSRLRTGVKLPVHIYDPRGNGETLLLKRGALMTKAALSKLSARGIDSVSVDARHANDLVNSPRKTPARRPVEKPQPKNFGGRKFDADAFAHAVQRSKGRTSPELETEFGDNMRAAESRVEQLFADTNRNGKLAGRTAVEVTGQTLDQLAADFDLFVRKAIEGLGGQKSGIGNHHHGNRTSQLAISMGTVAGLSREKLMNLGLGCLLATLGESSLRHQVQKHPRKLTSIEFLEITKIPGKTFDLLEQVRDIPADARNVAYQIRERWDGSGYPRNKQGEQINRLARIAMVAEAFVALVSDRPHRPAYNAFQAIRLVLQDTAVGKFEADSSRLLLEVLSAFPVGSVVLLSDGRIGRVVSTNESNYVRPVLELATDEASDPADIKWTGEIIDLADQPDTKIVDSIAC
ncbi:HD-GYP domain-containing protein [Stratiformator vulcanicus]|uniref:Cyclic di-GMP phosphodiesterase response regulator RpfG n=1 Tax=Stratiformator vulcanicus TaxID=2527980 RepID=A0A517QW18_9PLAN|nr:HD domain-containing phosphohydrolase [Stratiformator vulcanicus]QDT35859.1 Cyclic di-GMP phosphodiesterase response regulator RpfG [Stratiformator vulcanicus]